MSLSGPSRSTRADQEPHTTSPGALTVSRPRSQLCAARPMQRGPWTISVYVPVHALLQWQRPAALPTVAPAAPVAAGRSAHPPPRARAVQRCAQVKRQAEQKQSPLAGQLPPPAAWPTPVEHRAAQQHGVTYREGAGVTGAVLRRAVCSRSHARQDDQAMHMPSCTQSHIDIIATPPSTTYTHTHDLTHTHTVPPAHPP